MTEISIGERVWEIERARLGKYLDLARTRTQLIEAGKKGDNGMIAGSLYEYLRVCIPDFARLLFNSAAWYEIMQAYVDLTELNKIPKADMYALLSQNGKEGKSVPWDFPGRDKAAIFNRFAKAYGWTLDEIEDLWPEEAIGLLQEIIADEQEEKEFFHMLSEVAYSYNKSTKKSQYQPLERPVWMVKGAAGTMEERKKAVMTRMRRDLLPAGVIVKAEN
jgi:hypothetical protein